MAAPDVDRIAAALEANPPEGFRGRYSREVWAIVVAAVIAADDDDEDSAGVELERLECDVADIHDALCRALGVDVAGHDVALNADGIIAGIETLAARCAAAAHEAWAAR